MKKKRLIAFIIIIGFVLCLYFFGSGFLKNSSVYIHDYAISEDGREMNLEVGVSSSAGFIRKAAVHQQLGGKLYIDFYSAFGGMNGSVGAKTNYTVSMEEDTTMIAIYRNTDTYEEVLYKDVYGNWQRKTDEPYIVNIYEKTDVELAEEYFENDKLFIISDHYEMSDGAWKTEEHTYQYRLEVTGRLNAAVKDTTYVYLSNLENITFDQAWKASGLSSSLSDYFKVEDAKLVAMK